jgi:hypothetical protein
MHSIRPSPIGNGGAISNADNQQIFTGFHEDRTIRTAQIVHVAQILEVGLCSLSLTPDTTSGRESTEREDEL